MAWLPIETAPKDKAVLLSDGINVWRDVKHYLPMGDVVVWRFATDHGLAPTHWMRLPAPPEPRP